MMNLFKNNPFKSNPFAETDLQRSLREFTASVEDARRMEEEGTSPPWPTHLEEGMYQGVAIKDVPTWFLKSLIEQGPLEYALGEAVGHELMCRRMGKETVTLSEMLAWNQQEAQKALDEMRRAELNKGSNRNADRNVNRRQS